MYKLIDQSIFEITCSCRRPCSCPARIANTCLWYPSPHPPSSLSSPAAPLCLSPPASSCPGSSACITGLFCTATTATCPASLSTSAVRTHLGSETATSISIQPAPLWGSHFCCCFLSGYPAYLSPACTCPISIELLFSATWAVSPPLKGAPICSLFLCWYPPGSAFRDRGCSLWKDGGSFWMKVCTIPNLFWQRGSPRGIGCPAACFECWRTSIPGKGRWLPSPEFQPVSRNRHINTARLVIDPACTF